MDKAFIFFFFKCYDFMKFYCLISTGTKESKEHWGVIPNSFEQIFSHISQSQNQQYLVRASYLEIYQVIILMYALELCHIIHTGYYKSIWKSVCIWVNSYVVLTNEDTINCTLTNKQSFDKVPSSVIYGKNAQDSPMI